MSEDKLGIRERSALLVLMAEGKEISNTDLEKRAGLRLDGKARQKLNSLKLVSSRRKGSGPFIHTLTEKGWAWCADELTSGCPSRAGAAGGALYAVLAGLSRYLGRTDLSLADVFSVAPDIETRIRNAYNGLAKEPRDWVRLAHLRQSLVDLPKAEVDIVLRRMSDAKVVRLTIEENQKTLTKEDRAASIRLGPNEMHLMAIEE